jgi:hypothetical protein
MRPDMFAAGALLMRADRVGHSHVSKSPLRVRRHLSCGTSSEMPQFPFGAEVGSPDASNRRAKSISKHEYGRSEATWLVDTRAARDALTKGSKGRISWWLVHLAALGAAYLAGDIVLPLVLAFILKLLLQPIVRVSERLHVTRTLASLRCGRRPGNWRRQTGDSIYSRLPL